MGDLLPMLTTPDSSLWSVSGLFTTENLIALFTLTALEIVLGIDNIVFIAILTSRLPAEMQAKARKLGLAMAMLTRILLLFSITFIMGMDKTTLIPIPAWMGGATAHDAATHPEGATGGTAGTAAAPAAPGVEAAAGPAAGAAVTSHADSHHERSGAPPITGKDLVLLIGGVFLIYKSTKEIHEKFHHEHMKEMKEARVTSFSSAIFQIAILDIVFSLDSVITAVGTAKSILVMILAVMLAVGVMMLFANAVSRFVEHNPTIKMLALSFLLMIGVMLVAESLGQHIEKGYIYFAMGFSLVVEMLNIWTTRKPTKHADGSPGEAAPAAPAAAEGSAAPPPSA